MKKYIKNNFILLGIIAIGMSFAIATIGARFITEANNDTYDIVIDYNEVEEMASQSSKDVSWWLNSFKEMGITKVGLAEESFVTLVENQNIPVSAKVMDVVMRDANWEENYPQGFIDSMYKKGFDKHDLMVEVASKEYYDFIKNSVTERYQPEQYLFFDGEDGGYLILDGKASETLYTEKYKYMNSKKKGFIEQDEIVSTKLKYLNLGILPEKLKIVQDLGLEVVPRTANYDGWNDTKYAKAVIDSYSKFGKIPEYMIVGGESVIGYDDGINTAKNYIEETNMTLGLIESTTQLQNILQYGVNEIVESSDYNAVRIFSVWDYIQNRYKYYGYEGAEEIENTLFRAVTERNIRLIYYKPIKEFKDQHVYVTDVNEYKTMFSNLEKRLNEHGIYYAGEGKSASVMPPVKVGLVTMVILALACAAAAILLIKSIFNINRKVEVGLGILSVIGIVGILALMPSYFRLMISFGAAIVFACLAIMFYTRQSKLCEISLNKDEKLSKLILLSIATLIGSVIIAIIGGLMTAAPISSIGFMLEIDIFRGVKVAQLLPICFFAVAYLAYFGFGSSKQSPGRLEIMDLKEMMNASIKVWLVLIGLVGLGVGYYYIARTGHESSIEVSSLEMLFRNTLEDNLMARPRSKEFLFAFPAVMMMVYTSARKFKMWPVIFGLASVIGMTSVVNTFMHIRTPLYLGFIRTGYSMLLGIILGIVGILIFEAVYRTYKKYKGRLQNV